MIPVELKAGGLSVCLRSAGEVLRIEWAGRSSDRDPARILSPFFGDALQRAGSTGGGIEMHFEKLEHLNSSTISALITFLRAARDVGVELTMVFDPAQTWQSLSFEALRVFEKPDGLFKLRELSPAS